MALVRRDTVTEPSLTSETIAVDELGGDVEIRALPLDVLQALLIDASKRPEAAVCNLLAATVRADDGEPLWSSAQWATWGGANVRAVMRLYGAAQRVCGIGIEAADAAEKKSPSPLAD